jgi:hypothetical protein
MVDVTVLAAGQVPPVVEGLLDAVEAGGFAAVDVEAGLVLAEGAEVVRLLVLEDGATCVLPELVTTGLPGLVRPSLQGAWNCASASASVFVTALQPGSLGSQPLTCAIGRPDRSAPSTALDERPASEVARALPSRPGHEEIRPSAYKPPSALQSGW